MVRKTFTTENLLERAAVAVDLPRIPESAIESAVQGVAVEGTAIAL